MKGNDDMPAYKDEKTGKWYCKFYYKDWQGNSRQKKKMGFDRKKDAKEWESDFIKKRSTDLSMKFSDLTALYLEDIRTRLRTTTVNIRESLIKNHVLPYFGKIPVNQITPNMIREWQNNLLSAVSPTGNPYSHTYLREIHVQMTNIFNFAVKYYNLHENPCTKVGCIGKSKKGSINFWTLEEFQQFITYFNDDIENRLIFTMLYYTGMRIGELQALTMNDIDIKNHTISISKTYYRKGGKDYINPPKTPKSKRIIQIPDFLVEMISEYIRKLYGLHKNDRLFRKHKNNIAYWLKRGCAATNVKEIRLHDFRHSHASLLIEMGFTPLLVAERLGHESVETTLSIYSHLYPNKQNEVAEKLENLNKIVPF